MARKEAELIKANVPPRLINQKLRGYFPQRTVEAIRGRRKRQDYKNTAAEMVKAGDPRANTAPPPEDATDDPVNDRILQYLESMEEMETREFGAGRLQEIIRGARISGKESTLHMIALYLREIFPPSAAKTTNVARKASNRTTSKRRARRMEYATTQERWKNDRRRCIKEILEGLGNSTRLPRDVMEPYWAAVMRTDSTGEPRMTHADFVDDIWKPITGLDLKTNRIPKSSAVGPDGVSARLYGSVPAGILIRLYNLLMWCEGTDPEDLLRSKTVFVPKKKDAREPGEFRPITIPSVVTRGLHKILARRIESMFEIDPRQRIFRNTDGCADIFLLDMVLRYHRKKFRPMYMAALDVSKAFDSISHPAIKAVLEGVGVLAPAIRYLTAIYQGSKTCLQGEGWKPPCFTLEEECARAIHSRL